jgi:hypothetical protein
VNQADLLLLALSAGEVAPLELPYNYNFNSQTIGQPFEAGWIGQGAGYPGIIADGDFEANPFPYVVGHLRSDAGAGDNYYCSEHFALPGAIDITAGFRIKWWENLQQTKEATCYMDLLDANGDMAIRVGLGIINNNYYSFFYNSGETSLGDAHKVGTMTSLSDWTYHHIEVDVPNEVVNYGSWYHFGNFNKGGGQGPFSFGTGLWLPNIVTQVRLASASLNVWTDDRWLRAFGLAT